MSEMDHLSATFAALVDPTRRGILARLALGEASVSELSEPFDISAPAITKHLQVLQRAGLISQGRQKQWRPCKLQVAAGFIEQYRQFWEQRIERLDSYLQQLQSQEQEHGHNKK